MKKQFLKSTPSCKVTFQLPKEAAAGANNVVLLGDFNDWAPEKGVALKAAKDGSFAATVTIPTGRDYHFRYLIDGQRWENDWSADRYETSPLHGHIQNSVVSLAAAAIAGAVAEKVVATKVRATKKTSTKATTKTPKKVAKAAKATADKLTKIEGIGPKIEGLIKAEGINTFADLSKAKIAVLRDILAKAGKRYQMHDPSTWAKQAGMAAKGKWDELNKWQDELKGGRKAKK
ncbi:MAG: glycoside hydrolase family 13 [Bacteroidota bacterium]